VVGSGVDGSGGGGVTGRWRVTHSLPLSLSPSLPLPLSLSCSPFLSLSLPPSPSPPSPSLPPQNSIGGVGERFCRDPTVIDGGDANSR
jgi:hypothetical protein